MKALLVVSPLQRRAAAVAACVLLLAFCWLALFSLSRKQPSNNGKALAELKKCSEMLLTRNEELKNCQLESGIRYTDSPHPEVSLQSESSEVFDPVKWKEEILNTLPPKIRKEIAPNLDHYFGIAQKNFDELRHENRQIREDSRETSRKQDQLLKSYEEAADKAPKLEAKDQDLQICRADKTTLEERDREQVEKTERAVEDIRRFETSNLKCGMPSPSWDGLREAKKKELCSFLEERRKDLERLAGH